LAVCTAANVSSSEPSGFKRNNTDSKLLFHHEGCALAACLATDSLFVTKHGATFCSWLIRKNDLFIGTGEDRYTYILKALEEKCSPPN
jgi:hypothetical protein